MIRTRKLLATLLVVAVIAASGLTTAYATDTTQTYAYLPDHSVSFYDVDERYAWAYRQIDTLAVAGVVQGGGDHLFRPGSPITRADLILMLDRAYGMSNALDNGAIDARGSFVDVPGYAYYSKAVTAAKAFGVATGAGGDRFLPQQNITRQDAMVFLKRTLDWTRLQLQPGSLAAFFDADQVALYAREAVGALVRAGVIGGANGRLSPNAPITRAEIAVMLYRATHLQGRGSAAAYQDRKDIVNLCIGARSYCDVVIENYDPTKRYTKLMRYSGLRQENGVTYVTLEYAQPIDCTTVYDDGVFTLYDPAGSGAVLSYPAAPGCVAVDVDEPYHQLREPVSTGGAYRHCFPSLVDGEVAVMYYTSA